MEAPIQGNITWKKVTLSGETQSGGQQTDITADFARNQFKQFIRYFHVDGHYIYRDQLRQNYHLSRYHLNVHIEHLQAFNEKLGQWLIEQPATVIPQVCFILINVNFYSLN
jgi:DNA replication licensing factor MCM5